MASQGSPAAGTRPADSPFFTVIHAVTRLQLCYLFGDLAQALEAARTARGMVHHLSGTIWPIEFGFWNGLTLAAAYPQAPAEQRASWLAEIDAARRSHAALAAHCPENFLCQSLLLSAEMERIAGRGPAAQELYEQAIARAEESAVLRHQALASELCGRFWRDRGQHRVAAAYIAAARRAYAEWGAAAKVADLDRRHGSTPAGVTQVTASEATGSTTLAEVSSIEVGTWFFEDKRFTDELIARWNAGVPVRVLADPDAEHQHPLNTTLLNQMAAAGISVMPMMVIRLPITTGGKKRSSRLVTGASATVMAPPAITAPNTCCTPYSLPIMIMGASAMKEHACTSGSRAPNFQKPSVWISVATPEVSRLALMSSTTCAAVRPSALPKISGTATAPALCVAE